MRITPVHGDLPVVVCPPPALRLVEEAPAAPASVVVARAVSASDADATTDRRRTPAPKSHFDPPLIAQRAVLGLPVGPMIAELARASGTTYAAASAAVDREMPHQEQG